MNIYQKKQKITNINKIKNFITKNYFKNYLLSKFKPKKKKLKIYRKLIGINL